MYKLILTSLLALSACSNNLAPHKGTHTISVDERFSDAEVTLIQRGLDYWRMVDVNITAIRSKPSDSNWVIVRAPQIDSSDNAMLGFTNYNYNNIVIYANDPDVTNDNKLFASTIAHEYGHAMGLGHITDNNAVMSLSSTNREDLSKADVDEYFKVFVK
jgi:predicted Zn-dependent protease